MATSFEALPFEIYLALEDYLSLTDIILLSQTSNKLRHVFGPMSWRTCKLVTEAGSHSGLLDNRLNLIVTSPISHKRDIHTISHKVFFNPDRFSWFHPESVRRIVFNDLHSLIYSMSDLYKSVLRDVLKPYPRLNRLTFTSYCHPEEWRNVLQCHFVFSSVKNVLDCQLDLTFEKYTKHLSLEHDQRLEAFELNVSLSELEITNWGTMYYPESEKYKDFKPRRLKQLKISVVDPLELHDILECLNTIQRCDRLIVTMHFIFTKRSDTENGLFAQYTIDTLHCLKDIPHVDIKHVELNINKLSTLFYSSSRSFFRYADEYERQMKTRGSQKLIADRVTSISGAFEHCKYLEKFAAFPNLYECLSLSDLSSLSSHLPQNHDQLYFLDTITELDLTTDARCYRLFLTIEHFTNVRYLKFRIQDDVSLFAKEGYRDYIIQTTFAEFAPTSSAYICEDFNEFVQNIGSRYYSKIRKLAENIKRTYIDKFDVRYSRSIAQYGDSHIWRLFFMDCFIYNLRHLKKLEQVKIEVFGTQQHGRLFYLRLQELMAACKRLRNVSVQLMHFSHLDESKKQRRRSGMSVEDFCPSEDSKILHTIMPGVDQTEKNHYYLLEYYSNSLNM